MTAATSKRFAGLHCSIAVEGLQPGIVLVTFEGQDAGEHGDAPFREIATHFAAGQPIDLFIDARGGKAASVDVSAEWALWLATHRARFRQISMLTGSRFVQISADFVRKFADLGDLMRIYTDIAAFEGALAHVVANARASAR